MFNVKKADKLRKEVNKEFSLANLYIAKWEKANKKATPKKIKENNKKFGAIVAKQEKKTDKAYAAYYNYIHKNVSKTKINKALDKSVKKTKLGAMSKTFLNELSKK